MRGATRAGWSTSVARWSPNVSACAPRLRAGDGLLVPVASRELAGSHRVLLSFRTNTRDCLLPAGLTNDSLSREALFKLCDNHRWLMFSNMVPQTRTGRRVRGVRRTGIRAAADRSRRRTHGHTQSSARWNHEAHPDRPTRCYCAPGARSASSISTTPWRSSLSSRRQ
jgi:hypothetical protein